MARVCVCLKRQPVSPFVNVSNWVYNPALCINDIKSMFAFMSCIFTPLPPLVSHFCNNPATIKNNIFAHLGALWGIVVKMHRTLHIIMRGIVQMNLQYAADIPSSQEKSLSKMVFVISVRKSNIFKCISISCFQFINKNLDIRSLLMLRFFFPKRYWRLYFALLFEDISTSCGFHLDVTPKNIFTHPSNHLSCQWDEYVSTYFIDSLTI